MKVCISKQDNSRTQNSGQTGDSVGITVVIGAFVVVALVVVAAFVVVVTGPNGHKNGGGDKMHLQLDRS